MRKRYFLSVVLFVTLFGFMAGCAIPKNKLSLYKRSVIVQNEIVENQILEKAKKEIF